MLFVLVFLLIFFQLVSIFMIKFIKFVFVCFIFVVAVVSCSTYFEGEKLKFDGRFHPVHRVFNPLDSVCYVR